ncbi:MAG TPA: DUF6152 family protein [Gammaproteobacteria bacterium]|nr:DUF6152 family protein [Gammaproteobacteria bacterium]
MNLKVLRCIAGIGAAAVVAAPCDAHHSTAMFDMTKSVTLHGTVKEFQWTNPHCFIELLVPAHGTIAEWSIEMDPPAVLYRQGWRPGTLKAGDGATVAIHPVRDGTQGGTFIFGTLANGKRLTLSSRAGA